MPRVRQAGGIFHREPLAAVLQRALPHGGPGRVGIRAVPHSGKTGRRRRAGRGRAPGM